jgi:hypothetical protein
MMTALKEHYNTQQDADALTTSWNLMQVRQIHPRAYTVSFDFVLFYSPLLCFGRVNYRVAESTISLTLPALHG